MCGKPSASQNQWSEAANGGAAFLFNLEVGVVVGMCTCLTLCWGPAWIISRVCCGVSIIDRGLWAHTTTFESSSMVSRRLAITKPWPLHFFTLQMQEILGGWYGRRGECSAASIGCSGRIPDCCGIVRARLLRDSAYGGWRRRRPLPQCLQHRVLRREESKLPLSGGLYGTAHHTDSCEVLFNEIAADPESQLEIIWTAPGILSLVGAAAGDERCGGVKLPPMSGTSRQRTTFDFTKAFDSITHKSIWKALKFSGINHEYISLLKKIYKDQKASVQTVACSRARKEPNRLTLCLPCCSTRFFNTH